MTTTTAAEWAALRGRVVTDAEKAEAYDWLERNQGWVFSRHFGLYDGGPSMMYCIRRGLSEESQDRASWFEDYAAQYTGEPV